MPETVFGTGDSTVDVLNGMSRVSTLSFQETVPELSQENFKEYATGVLSSRANMNEWANNLVNRIGLVVQKQRSWSNPLAFLKRGMLEMGDTIEEIHTDLIKEKVYEPKTSEADAGKIYASAIPPVYAVFHKVNREGLYEVSFNGNELRKAFVSMRALEDFINSIYNTLAKSDARDEYLYMKELLNVYAERDLFAKVNIDAPINKATAEDLIIKVKAMSNKFEFISRNYNAFNVENHVDKNEQVIFISADLDALIDVNVLASAFNMDKTTFLAQRVVLDSMPVEDAHLILASRDMLMVYDRLFEITDLWNPKTLEWKYFYHHHQVLSTSRFENAVIFTSGAVVEPASVVVTKVGAVASKPGNVTSFKAEVQETGGTPTDVSQSVLWKIKGNNDANTTIDGDGNLSIALMETSTEITVMAEAVHYANIVGELAETITPR